MELGIKEARGRSIQTSFKILNNLSHNDKILGDLGDGCKVRKAMRHTWCDVFTQRNINARLKFNISITNFYNPIMKYLYEVTPSICETCVIRFVDQSFYLVIPRAEEIRS